MRVKSSRWARIATFGQAHWFFGNLYEAVVDVPRLTAAKSEPGLFKHGSPVRYYIPAATGITAYLVRSVVLELLARQPDQARRDELATKWHRGNLVRLAVLIVVRFAFRRATADRR